MYRRVQDGHSVPRRKDARGDERRVSLADRRRVRDVPRHARRQGRICSATPCGWRGQIRIAPPPDPLRARARRRWWRPRPGRGTIRDAALAAAGCGLKANDWNQVEILLDANILRPFLNMGGERAGGVAEDEFGKFGPIALYVGGTAKCGSRMSPTRIWRFRYAPKEEVSSHFRMQQLTDFYYAWGAAAADFNHDGVTDVVAGPHVFFGPDYTRRQEIYVQMPRIPSDEYTRDCWMQFVDDFTGDGWADVITASFSGSPACSCMSIPRASRGDGTSISSSPRSIPRSRCCATSTVTARTSSSMAERDRCGTPSPIPQIRPAHGSSATSRSRACRLAHGVGVGDINGDERTRHRQPLRMVGTAARAAARRSCGRIIRRRSAGTAAHRRRQRDGRLRRERRQAERCRHRAERARLGACVVRAEARPARRDLVRSAHDHGRLGSKNAGGVAFSQPHGSSFADVDGDGITDFIVGKRYWSHRDTYLRSRSLRSGRALLVPDGSQSEGAGRRGVRARAGPQPFRRRSDVLPVDLNKDGRMDVVTATRFGTFIFWGHPHGKTHGRMQ